MNKREIENILRDYHWMINSIQIMRNSMNETDISMTNMYGDESSLPKPKGTTSDPIIREVIRREKRWKKIYVYESKVKYIQDRMYSLQNEREIEVLHWLLEGKSYRWIGQHMGLSHSHIGRLKENIVDQIMKNVPNVTDGTKLHKNNSAC